MAAASICVVEIGGPGTIAKSLKALAVGGHVSLIGASLSQSGTILDALLLTGRGITVGAISVGSRADFEAMNRAMERPVIDRRFPFAEAKEAYRRIRTTSSNFARRRGSSRSKCSPSATASPIAGPAEFRTQPWTSEAHRAAPRQDGCPRARECY